MYDIGAALLMIAMPGLITGSISGLLVCATVMATMKDPNSKFIVAVIASCCVSSIVHGIVTNIFINYISNSNKNKT